MRALVQRVSEASVAVGEERVGAIGAGLLVLFCAEAEDRPNDVGLLARKTAQLRIFADEAGKMNRSVADVGGEVLVISQFTLAADCRKGNRPSFSRAAPPELAEDLYRRYCQAMRDAGLEVRSGRFAAEMQVALVNDGPVTIWLDTAELGSGGGHGR